MKIENYFKKYGKVYGVSYKYEFGWKCYCVEFADLEKAQQWLSTEEYGFRTRALTTKSVVINTWGKDIYNNRRKEDI